MSGELHELGVARLALTLRRREVSAVEDARAVLGLADARLEQIAEEGGAKGKLAEAAHKIVDKLDND